MLRLTFPLLALGALLSNACASSTPPAANGPPVASTPAARSAPSPAPTPQILIATAEETRLPAGGEGSAVVRLNIAAGWHVHANPPTDKFYIGTEVQAEPQGGVALGRAIYPPGEKKQFGFSPQPLASYEGSVAIRLPLRAEASAAKGAHTLRARVRYQPCNDRECLPPRTVEVDIPVTVG